jgi:hypothetical protein
MEEKNGKILALEAVNGKLSVNRLLERSASPVNEERIKASLTKPEILKPLVPIVQPGPKVVVESQPVEVHESPDANNVTMIEDLVVMLRERDLKQLEVRLEKIQKNPEVYGVVRNLLSKAVRRFRLENRLPDNLISKLSGSD